MNEKYIIVINEDRINILDVSNIDNDEIQMTESTIFTSGGTLSDKFLVSGFVRNVMNKTKLNVPINLFFPIDYKMLIMSEIVLCHFFHGLSFSIMQIKIYFFKLHNKNAGSHNYQGII